ncbi:MAG: tRNA-guanine transglycosylase DpdA [Bacillota bacterium]
MKILVISSCTSTKVVDHPLKLTLDDFRHPENPEHLRVRSEQIQNAAEKDGNPVARKAREMYTGRQHEYVVQGVNTLRKALGSGATVRLQIVSAGYGLLNEDEPILPYEATFNGMRKQELLAYSQGVLRLPEHINRAIEGQDLVFFLLGESYLQALEVTLIPSRPGLIFVAGTATKQWFPRQHRKSLVCFSNEDVKVIGGGQIGLKGAILKRFAGLLTDLPSLEDRLKLLHELAENPSRLRNMLQIPEQSRLSFPAEPPRRAPRPLVIPQVSRAKNATSRPLFFVPDWDDLVNPHYDFATDSHPQKRFEPYDHGVYAHEIYGKATPYDGILVSRAGIDEDQKKQKRFHKAHPFLRWPEDKPVMGDCGAYSYRKQEFPPYSTDDVLQYYEQHGFDIGVSVDHLIFGEITKNEAERSRRFRLTLDNAAEFLQKHRAGSYHFQPMGIAQGWDPASYEEAVVQLLSMGYKYIALGGLAFAKSQEVVDILAKISGHFPDDLYVHIFGVAREELLEPYSHLGVTAFDSATFLRRSWMSARDNYLDPTTGQWFTAIRVPPSSFPKGGKRQYHRDIKNLLDQGEATIGEIEAAEQSALLALRAYGRHERSLESTLEAVLAYDELVLPKGAPAELYRWTLYERPWERCNCPICSQLGIEVIIFRQNDRNRRRGFHNAYAFRRIVGNRLL